MTLTDVDADGGALVDLRHARWRWVDPALPADVVALDRVDVHSSGERSRVRLLLTFDFVGCADPAASDTHTLSAVELHYRALGRDRTNELELPVDLVIVLPPDHACGG